MRLQLLSGAVLGFGVRRALHSVQATASERAAVLPGDDLVPDATAAMNRGATFAATPEQVWPWLVQLGKGLRVRARTKWRVFATVGDVSTVRRRPVRRG